MTINFNFDTSYTSLPAPFFCKTTPSPAPSAKIIAVNHELAASIGIDLNAINQQQLADLFSGNKLPSNATPFSQAYAGHQYGHFTMLGDGRALIWGEHITPSGDRIDIQFKGSGPTPYSRRGDGKAVLGPMLREYLISEAMHCLGIPTTRCLAVATTGEKILRESPQPGAILTRTASSHIRVGTFEFAARHHHHLTPLLLDYTIKRHYPECQQAENQALVLLKKVIRKQSELIVQWMRVGFIHGVMNTDNMTLSGETIDYGPCAFLDTYHAETVFSSIDRNGRYAYGNQARIAGWNLARLAESLLPLIHDNESEAIKLASQALNEYQHLHETQWLNMMRHKIGITDTDNANDNALITELLRWMQAENADYTNTFNLLSADNQPHAGIYTQPAFKQWHHQWKKRIMQDNQTFQTAQALMRQTNPTIIPRNHLVEQALAAAYSGDLEPFNNLLRALRQPYATLTNQHPYRQPPKSSERVLQTFCGT